MEGLHLPVAIPVVNEEMIVATHTKQSLATVGLLILFSGGLFIVPVCADEKIVSGFFLPTFDTGEKIDLNAFNGKIVVLDFFAFWCLPCAKASSDLEKKIKQYYFTNGGNPQGIPVRLISMNVEADIRRKTAAFIKETGIQFVLNDSKGEVFKRYGGEALPFIVILDGLDTDMDNPVWKIVYRASGYEGFEKLRRHIDRIGVSIKEKLLAAEYQSFLGSKSSLKGSGESETSRESLPEKTSIDFDESPSSGRVTINTMDLSPEILISSDVALSESSINYRNTGGRVEYGATLSHGYIDIDYKPNPIADLIGTDNDLSEHRVALQLDANLTLLELLDVSLSGGFYDGFTDYRSLWLDEYYRQQFSGLPGYKEADPEGFNISGGLRWEYLPTTGFFEVNFSYQKDEIAPGYDRPLFQPLERGRYTLSSKSLGISAENVLTPRLRSLLSYRVTSTTGRSTRSAYQVSLNFAISENWVLRSVAGMTFERDGFRSTSFAETVEFDIGNRWFIGLSGRYYRDNGDVENSLLAVSTAAPDLESYQLLASVRWQGDRSAFKIETGPYITKYDAPETVVAPFSNLYSERDWLLVGLSYSYRF